MAISNEWDELYKKKSHMSIWPWSDLVSNVYRYAHPKNGYHTVLELGCGAGANIPLFTSLNFDYYGIDGSQTIVSKILNEHPIFNKKIIQGDFLMDMFPHLNGKFDLVIDRASITHNDTLSIKEILFRVNNYLRPGGRFIGIDWFSTRHSDSEKGTFVDNNTRNNLPADSHFFNVGKVHFSDREHILELFTNSGMTIIKLDHKEKTTDIPDSNFHFASWDIVAQKIL